MNNEFQRPAGVRTTEQLISISSVLALIRSHDETIPDYLGRFPFGDLVCGELVDIVPDLPFGGIKMVPVNHNMTF